MGRREWPRGEQGVYEALAVERDGDGFLSIASPEMFEATMNWQHRVELVQGQMQKFRAIVMRVENKKDDWNPVDDEWRSLAGAAQP